MSVVSPSPASANNQSIRTPTVLLMVMAVTMQVAFAAWMLMVTNFAVEIVSINGLEIGIQQSVREIPGFLSFAAVFLLFYGKEQTWAFISLLLLGGGAAITGLLPTFSGFLVTTFISSVGFHYYETMHQSLTLQWLPKKTAPATMGKILSIGAYAQLMSFGFVYLASGHFGWSFYQIFMATGLLTCAMTMVTWVAFPYFKDGTPQHKSLVLRKRYWLYYALTFIGGARRQIFVVFAYLLLVERFGFKLHEVAALAIVNCVLTMVLAPMIGRWIGRFGERTMLTIEYVGLALVFTAYAFVPTWEMAVGLYLVDHALFAIAIAMKTYFQKIADPADIASTAGVAFTINHIAAVFIPVLFGAIWLWSPAAVFLAGAIMALVSLGLARIVPVAPEEGNEFVWSKKSKAT